MKKLLQRTNDQTAKARIRPYKHHERAFLVGSSDRARLKTESLNLDIDRQKFPKLKKQRVEKMNKIKHKL